MTLKTSYIILKACSCCQCIAPFWHLLVPLTTAHNNDAEEPWISHVPAATALKIEKFLLHFLTCSFIFSRPASVLPRESRLTVLSVPLLLLCASCRWVFSVCKLCSLILSAKISSLALDVSYPQMNFAAQWKANTLSFPETEGSGTTCIGSEILWGTVTIYYK